MAIHPPLAAIWHSHAAGARAARGGAVGLEGQRSAHAPCAVAEIERLGGTVVYYEHHDSHGMVPNSATRPGPRWLRQILGDDFFTTACRVEQGEKLFSDADLQLVADLGQVKELSIEGRGITDAGVATLDELTGLGMFSISNSSITDAALGHLATLRSLWCLNVSNCSQLTDSGLANLSPLVNLRVASFFDSNLGDDGMQHLANLPSLENLLLVRSPIGDQGCCLVGPLPQA